MGKTFLNYNLNNDKVGDIYLIKYSKFNSINNNTLRPPILNYQQLSLNNNDVYNKSFINDEINDVNFINGIHYTLVIDVGGESLTNVPVGLEVHITADKLSNIIQLDFERKFKLNTNFKEQFIYLGKIENIYHKGSPLEWSFGLTRVIATNWFYDFLNLNNCNNIMIQNIDNINSDSYQLNGNNMLWNNEKNCLTFSKFLIQKFNYNNSLNIEWPLN